MRELFDENWAADSKVCMAEGIHERFAKGYLWICAVLEVKRAIFHSCDGIV
jgi:hypothetical protein